MPADALKCKECSATYPLDARYVCERCFGPLEVAYAAPARRPGGDQAPASRRARRRSGATPTSCRCDPSQPPLAPLPTGLTPLVRADRLAERLGLGELWIKNETANPTHSFKDRVVSVALARASELGFDTLACPSTGNLANAVAAHAAAAGLPAYVFIPGDLEEEKILATGSYGARVVGVRGNYDAVNRLCTELSAEREGVGVRQRQPPALLRRGLEDARLRDRRAARLGAPRPCRGADRVGLAVHEGGARLPRVHRRGALEGELPAMNGAQAEGCSPVAQAWAAGPTSAAPSSPTRSPSRWRSATPADGPYAVELAKRHRRRRSTRSPTTRSAPGSACWPRRPASSPRPRAASRPRCWPSSPSAATSTPASASSPTSPATG